MTTDEKEHCATEVNVSAVMSQALLTVDASESVLMAYELASRAGIHHVPVMAPDGRCVGVVGLDELRVWSIGPLGQSRPPVGDLIDRADARVTRAATLQEAAAMMAAHHTDVVLVVEEDRLVGLLTWRDVVRWVAGLAGTDHGTPRSRPVLFSIDPVIALPDRS